jgi:hypothetical protein
MPAFWIMLTGALLVLLWALASGFPLGGWLLAFVVTVFVGRLVSSLLGSIGLALYAVLVFIGFVLFLIF